MVDLAPVLVDEDSWKALVPYVHTLHVENNLECPASALSSPSTLAGTVVRATANGAPLSRRCVRANA
ncbi:hypothetical protein L210DRAFT_950259 [Boletus edulis BED1]|uniref:Uncharacterized protein n=1 Tax=Boletus edulis BED1 TaxID=1328754 RepID=A0AAD4BMR5_BOLED|nr:hypothetical protein L210DRAFT_950259 [Boletus edulis BED1]